MIAKATLDVIRCGKGAEGNVHAVCREVSRVLRPGGRFLVVSHADDWEEVLEAVSRGTPATPARIFGWTLERAKVPKPQTDPRHPDGAVLHVPASPRGTTRRTSGRRWPPRASATSSSEFGEGAWYRPLRWTERGPYVSFLNCGTRRRR